MAYKLLGDKIENPTDDVFNGATLIYISATSATEAILETSGDVIIGKIRVASGQSISLVKDATDKLSCPNSVCTPIANHW
tara:strand:- start:136 stop:375 length:240 start_codon:yes stop_codon:yes gene_type:complete